VADSDKNTAVVATLLVRDMQEIARDFARQVERCAMVENEIREAQLDIIGLVKRIDLIEQRHDLTWASATPLMTWHPLAAAQISETAAHVEALKSHHAELHNGHTTSVQAGAASVKGVADALAAQAIQIQSIERAVTLARRVVVWGSLAIGSLLSTLIAKLDVASIKAIIAIITQGSK
jgi:hypothetical protein